jgi:tetratricopeptide (TPR) repeat protein
MLSHNTSTASNAPPSCRHPSASGAPKGIKTRGGRTFAQYSRSPARSPAARPAADVSSVFLFFLRHGNSRPADALQRRSPVSSPTAIVFAKADAIEAWKEAIDIDPGEFYGLYNLWLELGRAGRADEARRYGQQFINTAPPAFFGKEREQIARYLAR